jgi:acyl transferase domain-containing protein
MDDACNYLKLRGLEGFHQSTDLSKSVVHGHINTHHGWQSDEVSGVVSNGSAPKNFRGLLALSAADEDGPGRQANALQSYLASLPADKTTPKHFSDLLHTLSSRRTHFPWRAFAICSSTGQAADELSGKLSKSTRSSKTANMHFVFTGQGAQWARMGLELLQYPVFRQSLEDCELYLKSLGCTWVLRGKIPVKHLESYG